MLRVVLLFPVLILLLFSCSAGNGGQSESGNKTNEKSPAEIHMPALAGPETAVLSDIPNYQRIILDIEFEPDISRYTVNQKLYFTNNYDHPLDELCFRTFMGVCSGTFDLHSYHVSGMMTKLLNDSAHNFLCIEFPEQLEPGRQVQVMLNYSVSIPEKKPAGSRLFAFYKNSLMFDFFYPSLMVCGSGGWDLSNALSYGDLTYNEAALFEVSLKRPGNFLYASTGTVTSTAKDPDSGTETDMIVTGPARSFFLAGGSGWVRYTAMAGETRINVCGRKEYSDRIEKTLPLASKILNTLSSVMTPYPYTEFDVAFVPAGWSAMEYPGIIAIGEYYLDNLPPEYKAVSFRNAELIMAHESVHQWFFNVVGNDQINEAWLDEAFAQYMVKYYYDQVYGPDRALEYLDFLERTAADTLDRDIPVNLPVSGYRNGSEYTKAVYGKAPLLFYELEQKAGTARFLEFVKWYQNRHRWQIVNTGQFLDDADEFFGESTREGIKNYFSVK